MSQGPEDAFVRQYRSVLVHLTIYTDAKYNTDMGIQFSKRLA